MAKKHKKRKLDINLIIAFGVLLASVGALIVSSRQASIMNKQTQILLEQSKSSAWPSLSLQMGRTMNENELTNYSIIVTNNGTGPAIVEQVILTYDDKPVANWKEFYSTLKVSDSIPLVHTNSLLFNRVIRANEQFNLISWPQKKELRNYIHNKADKLKIEIYYKSVYNDYWKTERLGFKSNLEKNISTKLAHFKKKEIIEFQE